MLNDLLLISGNDIPFPETRVTIHQPTIKEIAFIGEETFFRGCELLNFSKDILDEEVKISLTDKTNFEVFMSIITDGTAQARSSKDCIFLLLTLLFPDYEVLIKVNEIVLTKTTEYGIEEIKLLNNKTFENFKSILQQIFCLTKKKDNPTDYNPGDARAKAIANKLRKGREKAAAARNESQKISILSRYASILTIGLPQDLNSIMNYTVYQLYDVFQRFELKQNFDIYMQAKMAGAKDLEDVDNWMKDLHP